jgi:hypothetical protein
MVTHVKTGTTTSIRFHSPSLEKCSATPIAQLQAYQPLFRPITPYPDSSHTRDPFNRLNHPRPPARAPPPKASADMSFDLSLVSDTSGESDPLTDIRHLDRRHPGILVGLGISGLFEITTGHVLNAKHATVSRSCRSFQQSSRQVW